MKTFVKILSMLVAVIMLGSVGVVGLTAYAEPSDVLGQYDFSVVDNPYEDIVWYENNLNLHAFKASTHAHTVRSDGDIELNDTIWEHYSKGYEVLCLTDHGTVNGVDIKDEKDGRVTGARYQNGWSCGWTEDQARCTLYGYQSLVHGNIDEITESDYYDVIKGVSRNGRPQNLVDEGRGFFNLPLGNEANEASGNKCHVNTYNVSVFHGAMRNVEWPEGTVADAYKDGAYSHINHVGEWTDGNGDPSVYNDEWVQKYVDIFTQYCPNRPDFDKDPGKWLHENVTGQMVKKGVIGMELVNTSDNRTRNDRFYVYDRSLMKLAPLGINMYGFCEDDSHEDSDVDKNAQYFLVNDGTAWSEKDKEYYGKHYGQRNGLDPWVGYTGDITRSMTMGEFYACSVNSKNSYELGDGFSAAGAYPALRYFNINEESDQITLKVTNASKVRLVADGNIIATKSISEKTTETEVVFDLNAYEDNINSYVRIYMTGKGGITYLQPILLKKTERVQSYVQFILPSTDTKLEVFDASGAVITTQYTDNIYILPAGDYTYKASRKGYVTKENVSFQVTQSEVDAGTKKTITVELEKDENISQLYFYAPETIYLDPADDMTFKYYVDRENSDEGPLITSPNKTTGNVYFHRQGATEVTITPTYQEGATSLSLCSLETNSVEGDTIATEIKSGSLSSAISDNEYVLISWKAEYTFEGRDFVSYTYSYVYPSPDPSTKTLAAGGWAKTKKAAGWLHSTMQVVSSVFAYGFHSIETTNANGYAFAPYYYTGTSVSSTGPAVSGTGYAWTGDDSSGGSRNITSTGGTGYIYADVSRDIDGFEDIPLFTFGMDINDADECDEGGSYTFSMTGGGATHTFCNVTGLGSLTPYDGQRVYQYSSANGSIPFGAEESISYTLVGDANGEKSSRNDRVTSIITINVIKTNKSELRTLYNTAVSDSYQQDWFETVEEYTQYISNLIAAAKVLGNPAATPDDITEATNNLKSTNNNVKLREGNAQVKHYWIYDNRTGEIQSENQYSYTLSDVLVANSTKIDGFTYAGAYDRLVDGKVIKKNENAANTGTAEFETLAAVEDNYVWIFYYRPNTYDITYYTGTDGFKPEGGSGTFAVYNQNYTITTSSPSRPGYIFRGWYLDIDPTFTVHSSGETIKYSYMSDGQFVAKWEALTYNVNYELNGGGFKEGEGPTEEEKSVVFDQTYTICTDVPEREGYNFVGWKTDDGEIHSAGSQFPWTFAADGTLEAQWSNIGYQVTFNPNADGATVNPSTATVYYDKEYGTLATAQRPGYTYQWYANPGPQFPDNALVTAETIVKIPSDHTLYAKWTPINYTIKYNLDGGYIEGVNPITYNIESDPITLKNPKRTGYTFVGWSGTDLDTTSYTMDVTIPTGKYGDREYKANWKADVYTITYNLNADASSVSPPDNSHNPTTFTYADNITILPPTRAGYTFGGWTGGEYTNIDTITIPAGTRAESLTLDASWNIIPYKITYQLNKGEWEPGSSHPSTYTIEEGFTVDNPKRDGYEFYGWQSDSLTTIESNLSRPAGTYGDFVLSAVWKGTEGKIIYNLNGGTVIGDNPEEYTTGNSFTITNPQRTGYNFDGWDKFSVLTGITEYKLNPAGINTNDTGTIYFTAQWSAVPFAITYNLDGGHYETAQTNNIETYTADTDTFTLTNPIKEGYIFNGWKGTDIIGTSKSVTIQKGSTGERSYTADWIPATYTITYDYAGGAADISHISTYTFETADTLIGAPIRTGYTFNGWTQSFRNFTWKPGKLNDEGYFESDNDYYLSSPILLRSGYTYRIEAGSNLEDVSAYMFGAYQRTLKGVVPDVSKMPELTFSQEGAAFVYFVVTGDFLEAAYRDTIKITIVGIGDDNNDGKQMTVSIPTGSTGNIHLVADWTVETYGLTYDLSGGHFEQYDKDGNLLEKGDEGYIENYDPNPSSFTVESGNILLKNPVKAGYNFIGWDDGHITSPSVIIKQGSTGTRHYTAKWTETTYSINYELNGGVVAVTNPANYSYSTESFTLNNPTRTGYTFDGWMGTGINGVSKSVTILKGSTGNRSYTATWTPDTYGISYNLNGGVNASANPNTYTYETETFTLAHPTKSGAVFAGWTGTGLSNATMTVTIPKGSTGNREYTANWNVSNYTISYNLVGGTNHENNPQSYTVDTETFTLGKPSKTGYSFAGWTGTGLNQATEFVEIAKGSTGNRIYTATWNPVDYTINYVLGTGAQVGVANPTTYTIETPTFTLNNPVRLGYTFEGWSGTGIDTATGFAKTVTVYRGSVGTRSYVAIWKVEEFTISYALNGGTAIGNPTTYRITDPDIKLNNPTRTGYEFTAWSGTGITGDGFAKEVIIPTGSSGNRTYTANWKLVDYTIGYDLDGGDETISNPRKYNYLTAQITLHSPVKPGYEFVGWVDADDETETPQAVVVIPTNSTGDRYFTAIWAIGDYTISYDLDGGNWPEGYEAFKNYTYNSPSIEVEKPIKEGYVFAGWSGTGISGTSMDLTIPQYSTGNRSYKAHWSEGENIITYDLVGGRLSGDENPTSYVTGSGDIILNNPVKSGYRFAGWTGTGLTEATKEVVIDTSNGGALSFTATWTPVNYKITYTLGGGALPADVTNPATYTVEDQVTLNNPVRTGYTFKGWTGTDLTGAQPTVIIVKGSTGARAYTAVWEEEVYTISYNYGAGSVAISNPFEYTFTTPTFALNNPTLTGYDFIGWSGTDIDGTAMTVVIEKGSTGNRSYTANYDINTYTIKYLEVEGATFTNAPATYTALDEVVIPNPTKIGYLFKGWSGTGINGIKKDVVIEAGSAGNRVYTAEWEAINYSITYDLNSGRVSGINPATYTVESADISVLNPGRAGYDFEGWTLSIVDFIWSNGTIGENGGIADGAGYYSMIVSLKANTTYTFADNVKLAVYKTDGTFIEFADKGSYTATEDCVCSVVVGAMTEDELKSVAIVADGNVANVTIPRGNMGSLKLVANWKSQEFTITYYLNSGSLAQGVTNPEAYNADTADFTLYNPTRTGYIFSGWTGTGLDKATTTVTVAKGSTGNRVYTANWRIERYNLSIDLNGGSFGTVKVPESYTIDTPTFTLPIPVKSGYTFTGWLDADGTTVWNTVTISKGSTGDLRYTAQWEKNTAEDGTHRIYYYGFNNQLIGYQDVKVGIVPTGIEPQIVIGYQFAGWSVALNDSSVVNSTEDVHIYSTYKVGPDTYDVTVWINGNKTTTNYSQYATVKVTAAATSNGNAFSYWAVADENGNATTTVVSYYQSFSFKAHADISIVAVYGSTESVDKVSTRITKAEYNEQYNWISFYAERSVASEFTILQHGIMFTDDVSLTTDDSEFVLGTNNSRIYVSTASSTSRSGVYTLSIGGLKDKDLPDGDNTPYAGCKTVYARSYIIYRDANGNTKTVYSDVVSYDNVPNNIKG